MQAGRDTSRRRAAIITAGAATALVGVYAAVLFAYWVSTKEAAQPDFGPAFDAATDVGVLITPTAVVPTASAIDAVVELSLPPGYVDVAGALTRTIEVAISPAEGKAITFASGRLYAAQPVRLRTALYPYQNYPFDSTSFEVSAQAFDVSGAERRPLQTAVDVPDEAPGFRISMGDRGATDSSRHEWAFADVRVRRSGSTVAVVILLLIAMAVLAALAGLVSRAVAMRRRQVEATMAGWFAAMLFAIVPLRTNMPGAPPIGAWLDFAVVLWVELILMYTLAVFIGAWLRYGREPEQTAPAMANPSSPAGAAPTTAPAAGSTPVADDDV